MLGLVLCVKWKFMRAVCPSSILYVSSSSKAMMIQDKEEGGGEEEEKEGGGGDDDDNDGEEEERERRARISRRIRIRDSHVAKSHQYLKLSL